MQPVVNDATADIPDNTPILVGAGQFTEQLTGEQPPLSPPMELAARAARHALQDTGDKLSATDIETIAAIKLFSDSVPTWDCPFGRSENPPDSIARRLGSSPKQRIYSNVGGTQPLQILMELCTDIASGHLNCALLAGAEAIASQRYALRQGLEPDWNEPCDLPLDDRAYTERFASQEELRSGMYLPVHYYALIENLRAQQQGNDLAQHQQQMARLFAPFSDVARDNPYAFWQQSRSIEELCQASDGNYPISLPYGKRLVAQDAVNQAAAVLVTSAGFARARGIDPSRWVSLQGYAQGFDQVLSQRLDPGKSQSMEEVFAAALAPTGATAKEMALVDIYSCFPCAVEAACDALDLPRDGSQALTVTGGLPYFGGPGNNYSLHAIVEMVWQLRGTDRRGLVTANGGQLSKHAALVLSGTPAAGAPAAGMPATGTPAAGTPAADLATTLTAELAQAGPKVLSDDNIPTVPYAQAPEQGRVLTYTVIFERKRDDLAVVLGETAQGERFFARSAEPEIVAACTAQSPIGRWVLMKDQEGKCVFEFAGGD